MWRDTREVRLRRYREMLRESPRLYKPAEALQEEKKNDTEEEYRKTFENVCDYVLAPALNGFVQWVLREALHTGKRRLYFLARDGYFMYQAALVYCKRLKLPLECRYLSCSRYSIRIPMFHLDIDGALEYICRGGIDVTMQKILNRAGLTQEEQEIVLKDLNLAFGEKDMLPYAAMQEIRGELKKCDNFQKYMYKHSSEAMPELEGYLIQEGLFDGIPSALVDSGWVGSMQKVLNQLAEHIQKKNHFTSRVKLDGYYWGLYELPSDVRPEDYHCYYFSPGGNLRQKVYFSNSLFEGIFSAPHGMTIGYKKENGRYRPIYGEISDEQKKFMELTEQRLMKATEQITPRLCRDDLATLDCQKDHQIIRKLLRLFMSEPTVHEAEIYGSLHFSDDVLDYGGHQMAEPMSQKELTANHLWHKALAMLGVQKVHVKESAWYEGSAVRGGKNVKHHLRRYAGYKYLLYLRKRYLWRKIYG